MSKLTQTVSALVQMLFPNSAKALSETLSVEQFNSFTADAQEIQNRLDAQQQGNSAEQADRQQAEEQLQTLQTQLTEAQTQLTDLTSQVTQLTTDKATAQAKITELQAQIKQKDEYIASLKASVNPLAADDASNGGASEMLTDTDRMARENAARFKQSQA